MICLWRTGDVAFPKRICAACAEEFELRPDKPGFANRCPACSEEDEPAGNRDKTKKQADSELTDARKRAMRDLLYRKDS